MYYYIEHDGKLFLVEKNGEHTLPSSKNEIPFPFHEITTGTVDNVQVMYCISEHDGYPEDWIYSSDTFFAPRVSLIVRKAVLHKIPWKVGKAFILNEKREVLLVKGGRGVNAGQWMLPGGISMYGETSSETAIRETEEECGIAITIIRLLTVVENATSFNKDLISFIYQCTPVGGTLRPNMDDVVAAQWVPLEEALEKYSYYAFPAVKQYLDAGGKMK